MGFSSISTSAEESKLQSDLASAAKKIAADMVDSETPPANADGLPKSEGVNYQYTQEYDHYRGEVYCITATSTKSGTKTYYSDNGSAPKEGACPGHSYGAGSPNSPAIIGAQKLNTFVANIKAHAQANGLTIADYSTDYDDGPIRVDNTFSANPGLSRGGHYNDTPIDADGYKYSIETFNNLGHNITTVDISSSSSWNYLYLRPGDGLVLHPVVSYQEEEEMTPYYVGAYGSYLALYMPYIASNKGTTVEQLDATTAAESFADLAERSIYTPISGGPGGPWVFGLDPGFSTAIGSSDDLSSCRYNVSNVGQGYVKLDSYSC